MNPLPDRTVVIGLLATLGVVFALVFWFVRLAPSQEPPLLWRGAPGSDGTQPLERRSSPGPQFRAPGSDRAPAGLI